MAVKKQEIIDGIIEYSKPLDVFAVIHTWYNVELF